MVDALDEVFYSTLLSPQAISLLFVALLLAIATSRTFLIHMALENLGLSFVVNWIYDTLNRQSPDFVVEEEVDHRHKKKNAKNPSRAKSSTVATVDSDRAHYPGLVNISGTYCFMNSVLQAFASLNYLQPYIDLVHNKAEQWDVPTPVIDTLRDTLKILNTPQTRRASHRPVEMIETLSAPAPNSSTRSLLFSSREHQDAQELFQLLSSLMKDEATLVDREALKELGLVLALVSDAEDSRPAKEVAKGVFDGLTANRRSCIVCGYTEAVMHFGFDNLQLALPIAAEITLEECFSDFTHIEMLTDCICRKCSLLATHQRLLSEVEKLSGEASADGELTQSKKKRAREARKFESRVKSALAEGRIEDDVKGLKMERVFSKASTKQVMIARTPPVLALHLNRSTFYGHATKNPCRVVFPEILDLTPFTTSGQLSTQPSSPISPSRAPSSTSPLTNSRVLYRLSSTVCHYGGHAFGHYVAYRRKPKPPSHGSHRFSPPTLADNQSNDDRWLRISDEQVEEVSIQTVLSENSGTFMLFYERILDPEMTSPHSAEKTSSLSPLDNLISKPAMVPPSDFNAAELMQRLSRQSMPRVVRSVSSGMISREKSLAPMLTPKRTASPAREHSLPSPLHESAAAIGSSFQSTSTSNLEPPTSSTVSSSLSTITPLSQLKVERSASSSSL